MPTKKSSKTTRKTSTTKATASSKSKTKQSPARKRELINTGRDKRFVRRDESGKFDESVDVSRSLSADRRSNAKKELNTSGFGDKGDRKRKK